MKGFGQIETACQNPPSSRIRRGKRYMQGKGASRTWSPGKIDREILTLPASKAFSTPLHSLCANLRWTLQGFLFLFNFIGHSRDKNTRRHEQGSFY